MNRRDAHFDAMLRHLGAAYYESLHGRATAADVARALGSVEEHVGEPVPEAASGATAAHPPGQGGEEDARHHPRWHRRVRDVMTTSVVTVDRITPYKEIVTLLAEHRISAVPVLTMGRHVAGVVSEADLLALEEQHARAARGGLPGVLHRPGHDRHAGHTAADLMTSPAVTIHPDATIPAAARLMNSHHVRRLPVVNADKALIGIVSRRDLLSVFLRRDEEIAGDVRRVFEEILFADPASTTVAVRGGVVTLTGTPEPPDQRDLIPVAIRLIWDIDGVVDVVNRLGAAEGD
jgi:CBS domain-containing protein